ncbi:MAG: type sorting protein [Bacteroidetes bacterium]|nr:type sorting protein [Bacteroidota bacterium]
MKNLILIISFIIIPSAGIRAQFTWLDHTFHSNGMLQIQHDTSSLVSSVVLQPDSKILALCNYSNGDVFISSDSVVIYRINPDGTPDLSFGHAGSVSLALSVGGSGANMILQPDNKILITVGFTNAMYDDILVRLNPDGSFDNSFGTNGVTSEGSQTVTSSGAILLHNSTYLLNVIDAGGPGASSRFTWFDASGNIISDSYITPYDTICDGFLIRDMIEQPDSTILAAGAVWTVNLTCQYSGLARFKKNGQIDSTFATKGIAYLSSRPIIHSSAYLANQANSIAIQSDGKILIAGGLTIGHQSDSLFVARYTHNGLIDTSFGGHGITTIPLPNVESGVNKIVLQTDGKIILVGRIDSINYERVVLARLNTDGTLDTSFGSAGTLMVELNDGGQYSTMAIQSDGKIVVAGFEGGRSSNPHIIIARYLPSHNVGVLNFTRDNNNIFIYPNPVRRIETLEYTLQENEVITIELQDISGKDIFTYINGESQPTGVHTQNIILSDDLPSGAYIIAISSPKGKVGIKVIKE